MMYTPDFFLVGAAKAGTTALQQALDAHPDIYMSPLKEPNFFCSDIDPDKLRPDLKERLKADNTEEWINSGMQGSRWRAYLRDENLYSALFAPAQPTQVTGEASVSYLYSTTAAENIAAAKPNAKIIIVLRNPIERAWSHYLMEERLGMADRSFELAFKSVSNLQHPMWGRDLLFLHGGLYNDQIKRYLKYFDPSQLHIIIYDDYRKQPQDVLKKLYVFLGVDPTKADLSVALKRSNEARTGVFDKAIPSGSLKVKLRRFFKSIGIHSSLKNMLTKPSDRKVGEQEKKILSGFYLHEIEELEKTLNLDLSLWKK
jgi:Sulfotransferase family